MLAMVLDVILERSQSQLLRLYNSYTTQRLLANKLIPRAIRSQEKSICTWLMVLAVILKCERGVSDRLLVTYPPS